MRALQIFSLSLPLFASAARLSARAASASCGETTSRVCFGVNGGDSQNVNVDDVQYVADYLRYIGSQNSGLDAMWKMPAAIGCDEWQLPIDDAGTVLALAKHITPRVNSTVLYEDIATAIDGGENATDDQKKNALLAACGTHGGMVGVTSDPQNPAYNTPEYLATKAKPSGILVKIVKAPSKN